jgi:hypothetical protein
MTIESYGYASRGQIDFDDQAASAKATAHSSTLRFALRPKRGPSSNSRRPFWQKSMNAYEIAAKLMPQEVLAG